MISLFIDTHDKDINIVLYKDGEILDKNIKESERHHSDFIMPMIKEILDRNNITVHDINEIYVVNGPGSFTGVRLGVTIAKTLAYTLNVPVKTLTSLEMFAVSNESSQDKIVVIDDLKGVFGAKFNSNNEIIDDYFYKSNDEYKSYLEEQDNYVIVDNKIDFNKVYELVQTKETVNPHKREASNQDILRINEIGLLIKEDFDKVFNIEEDLTKDYVHIYVYEEDNKILGFLHTEYHFEITDIVNIAVDINNQHNGIGYKLIEYLLNNTESEKIMLEVRVNVDLKKYIEELITMVMKMP